MLPDSSRNLISVISRPRVGNLSLVAGQKQTVQDMASRTIFTNNSVHFAVYDVDYTWEFMDI